VLDVGGGAGIVRQFLPPDTKFVSVDPYVDYEQGIGPAKRQAYFLPQAAPQLYRRLRRVSAVSG